MKQTKFFFLICLLAVVAACSSQAKPTGSEPSGTTGGNPQQEQKSDYPAKTIEMIVPYAPGGTTDIIARTLANSIGKYLPNNQPMVVVNKPGGSGTIGLTDLFNANPDGYTLGMTSTTATSVQPHYGNTPYTHEGFQAITRVLSVPQVLVVRADAKWDTFEQWLEYVKANPDQFTYAVPTKAGSQYLAMEALSSAVGIKLKPVPFDGAAPAMTALLGEHVDGLVVPAQDAKAQAVEGTVKALINVGSTKVAPYEDIPLLKEKGIDVAFDIYTGILAPKGLPSDVLQILDEAFKKTLEDPEVIEQIAKLGSEPAYAGPEAFQEEISQSFIDNGKVMKDVGLLD